MTPGLQVVFASKEEFAQVFASEISRGGLLVRGAALSGAGAGATVTLSVRIGDGAPVEVPARVAAVVPVGVAVMFDGVPAALAQLGEAQEEPVEDEEEARPPGPLTERLKKLSVTEKMQLALSGSRDERAALLRDPNKVLHVYVLKNPRLGLDEVQAAAKLPQLSPDALKMIAEHREWGTNTTICTALVRNPKTPLPLALRLLERVPASELRAMAKGGVREQLKHAALKKVAG
ncbi:MAG: hypothetical protein ACOZQL_33040 [Myxococcota bacterium]